MQIYSYVRNVLNRLSNEVLFSIDVSFATPRTFLILPNAVLSVIHDTLTRYSKALSLSLTGELSNGLTSMSFIGSAVYPNVKLQLVQQITKLTTSIAKSTE